AEDGIRDFHVTGVQTCALPISVQEALQAGASRSEVAALIGEAELLQGDLADARRWLAGGEFSAATRERGYHALARLEMTEGNLRSEERRVGKEWSARMAP